MKLNLKCLAVVATFVNLGLAVCTHGQDLSSTNQYETKYETTPAYQLYRPFELDADFFGSSALNQHTFEHFSWNNVKHNIVGGGGVGLTGYFWRYFGVGGEFDADARAHEFLDSASGNVYLRVPLFHTGLAPYAFGGGGYQFENLRQSFGQGGLGLEYRFCRHIGIFADARWIVAEHSDNYALSRVGLRLSF